MMIIFSTIIMTLAAVGVCIQADKSADETSNTAMIALLATVIFHGYLVLAYLLP